MAEKEVEGNNQKSEVAKREEKILEFWQANKIFEKSVDQPAGKEPIGEYVFYDGPPFATGTPHFGHLLPTSLKDVIPRYKTMRGFRINRRWGWDCHGLPVENIVEKELNLKIKKDIEEYGIAKFNQAARASVLRFTEDWKKVIPRMGRWVDMENDYRTMDSSYTEAVWAVFKTLYDKKLIYEGYKSMHICPRCETTLANFEVNQGYKDIADISVYVKFELIDPIRTDGSASEPTSNRASEPKTYLLAWTTTPWTLPCNVALAVNPDITYVKAKKDDVFYILSEPKAGQVLKEDFEIISKISGEDLIGKKYKPVFDYYSTDSNLDNRDKGWKIYGADFVTAEEGTGIVHIAPAFGENDMQLGQDNHLPFIQHVGMDGKFKSEVKDFSGLSVKPKDDPSRLGRSEVDHQATDIEIIKYLAHNGKLFAKEKITHSYPHCWRCDTPLLNYAASSWFVRVSDFKDKLLAANSEIHWTPAHIKEGRFGKWLEGARDWAISRSRFWGAPIPVWKCDQCEEIKVIGSIKELSHELPQSTNKYLVMRHGEADSNVQGVVSGRIENQHRLTDKGREEVRVATRDLPSKKIDLVFSSPFLRTKETAEIVAEEINLLPEKIIFDDRLAEVDSGDFNNRPVAEYHQYFKTTLEKFTKPSPGGETLVDLKNRMLNFIREIDKQYSHKTILIISHEYPIWLLGSGLKGWTNKESARVKDDNDDYIKTAGLHEVSLETIPRNSHEELDLHRPYIDECQFACPCGGAYKRVLDVFDCWFESGAMPYGQKNYLGQALTDFDPTKNIGFPADFIVEGLDQTRGWFYSLLVLSVALFDKSAYKNVIVNGLILAEDGQKMSKRLKNYPDLDQTIDQYGADALRLYLLGSPAAVGEDFNFSEKDLNEIYRKVILRLDNVYAFYNLYVDESSIGLDLPDIQSKLNQWVLARLAELKRDISEALENYEVGKAIKSTEMFVDDLSTWYIRRSRDVFKSQEGDKKKEALATLGYVLAESAKTLASLIPFITEDIYQKLIIDNKKESVHLEAWPKTGQIDEELLKEMKLVRSLVESALSLRATAGIKVRQPLSSLSIKNSDLKNSPQLLDLIKDEVNVKEIIIDESLIDEVKFDTTITLSLKEEGVARDLVRQIQELRKDSGLVPGDKIIVSITTDANGKNIITHHEQYIKEVTGAREIIFTDSTEGEEINSEDFSFKVVIRKI